MCGILPQLLEDKVFNIFCYLLMIFHVWLGFIFWKQNQKFLRSLLSSIILYKLSITTKFKSLDLITGGNMWTLGWHLSSLKRVLSTKLRVLKRPNRMAPLEVFSSQNSIPLSSTLEPKLFGCTVFAHIPKHDRDKFSSCAVKCVFLGYGKNQKGYRCYDLSTDRMYITMNCDFVESEYFYSQSSSQGESETGNQNSDVLHWLPLWEETIQGEDIQRENSQPSLPEPNLITEVGPTE